MQYTAKTKRCLTEEQLKIQQNAALGIMYDVPKPRISKVVKGLCTAWNLGAVALAVVDIILGDLQENDCQSGARAICFRSNRSFATALGVDETSVQRALGKLAEHNLITFHDSANGKRYRCKKTGVTFGIDLTPAWNQYADLSKTLQAFRRAQEHKKALRRCIKSRRKSGLYLASALLQRAREAQIEKLVGELEGLQHFIATINRSGNTHETRLALLETKAARLVEIAEQLEPESDQVPAPTRSSTGAHAVHQYNTSLVPLKNFGVLALEDERHFKPCLKGQTELITSDQPHTVTCEQRVTTFDKSVNSRKTQRLVNSDNRQFLECDLDPIDLELLNQALPRVLDGLGLTWKSWRHVEDDVFALKRCVGLSDYALEKAVSKHHPRLVAVTLAVVLEMQLRNKNVEKPGGYVVWLFRQGENAISILTRTLLSLMELEPDYH